MRRGQIIPIGACGEATSRHCDPNTTHVYRLSFINRFEISHRDGKFWYRAHRAPVSIPWTPAFSSTLKELKTELFEEAL